MPDEEDSSQQDWRPSVSDVAAILTGRTYVEGSDVVGGSQAGTFTGSTRPTDTEVEAIIDQVVADVEVLFVTNEVPESSQKAAKRVATLKASLFVELSYFPEQAEQSSPYLQLRSLHDQAVRTLIASSQVRDLFGEIYPTPEITP